MVVLDATIVNIALPEIQTALGFSPSGLSWVVNAYTLTFGGLLLLGARAGDLLGRRRTFLAGIALFTLASLAGGFATSAGLLLAARAVQGVGGALAAPSALALLMTMFAEGRERTRALGLYTARLHRRQRRRPGRRRHAHRVGLVALGAVRQRADRPRRRCCSPVPCCPRPPRHAGRFDLAGALTSTLGMAALVYGFVHAATDGWGDGRDDRRRSRRASCCWPRSSSSRCARRAPITPLRLFADRSRGVSYVARLLLVAGMFGMFFFLTQFLQDVLGYTPARGRARRSCR